MANENKKQNQIQIEVPNDEMQGRYANLAVISHSPNDFVMDMIERQAAALRPQGERRQV